MMKICNVLSILLFFISFTALSAKASQEDEPDIKLSGYLETYYIHDLNHPPDKIRPGFTYSHNTIDKPSINLGLLKVSLNQDRLRANLAIGSGSYMRTNYAAEPKDLQKIFEANVGFKLANDLWLDAGVMPSHIGFESAIGIENWTVTRSMMADNSPYFETGIRLSYTSDDGKWYASGLILNGWQRIQRPDGNTTPSFGHQLTYRPTPKITLNSSSFIGNDKSDQDRKMRYFHNLYGQYQLDDQWGVITALDIGAEQANSTGNRYHVWFTPVFIVKYTSSEKLSISARAEYYQDKNEVIVTSGTSNGFKTFSYSTNLDYKLSNNFVIRTELKRLHSSGKIFQDKNGMTDNNVIVTTAAILNF